MFRGCTRRRFVAGCLAAGISETGSPQPGGEKAGRRKALVG
jgi:hypothetical protein